MNQFVQSFSGLDQSKFDHRHWSICGKVLITFKRLDLQDRQVLDSVKKLWLSF